MIKYVTSGESILEMLKKKGFTPIVIRKYGLLSESTLQNLRKNKMISIDTLGKVCDMLDITPDIIIYNDTKKEEKEKLKNILKSVK
jgi:DNA-binding Xre family transcriptional regulator